MAELDMPEVHPADLIIGQPYTRVQRLSTYGRRQKYTAIHTGILAQSAVNPHCPCPLFGDNSTRPNEWQYFNPTDPDIPVVEQPVVHAPALHAPALHAHAHDPVVHVPAPIAAGVAEEVHREFRSLGPNIDSIVEILKADIGNPHADKYANIIAFLDGTVGTYIRVSPEFSVARADWTDKFRRILARLDMFKNTGILNQKNKIIMGTIVDFVQKHELEQCFITSLVSDCASAYPLGTPGHEDGMSCGGGIVERFPLSLKGCILDKKDGVFESLLPLFGIDSDVNFNAMSSNVKATHILYFNNKLKQWMETHGDSEEISKMTATEKENHLLQFVIDGSSLPKSVINHYKADITEFMKVMAGGRSRKRKSRKHKSKKRKSRKFYK